MKHFLIAFALMTSFQALAYETNNSTSYSGPAGGSISGSTSLSGTSAVAAREQVAANQVAVATFLQSDAQEADSPELQELIDLGRQALHEHVELMSDREILNAILK